MGAVDSADRDRLEEEDATATELGAGGAKGSGARVAGDPGNLQIAAARTAHSVSV